MHQYDMNSFDYSVLDELNFESLSAESYSSYPDLNPKSVHSFNGSAIENPQTGLQRPAKQLKTSSWNSCTTDRMTSMAASSTSSRLISFENSNSVPATSQKFLDCTVKPKNEAGSDLRNMNFPTLISESSFEIQNCSSKHEQVPKRAGTMTRTPIHAQDHVMAERKRREKLSQRFIALSAIVPGLKKVSFYQSDLRVLVLKGLFLLRINPMIDDRLFLRYCFFLLLCCSISVHVAPKKHKLSSIEFLLRKWAMELSEV